tara:strand:+ start:692 stop:913 length:222 start_codon:yes stop_codon:yes gene_type:complete
MSVTVKNFGDDSECNNAAELKMILRSKYLNTSVSIVYRLPSGVDKIVLADVQSDGSLIDTHRKTFISLDIFNY